MENNIYEPVDNTPVEIPTRLRLPQSRTDQIRMYIREELSRAAQSQSHETFEEADDVEPHDEENLPLTRYVAMLLEPDVALQHDAAPTKPGERVAPAPVDPAPSSEVNHAATNDIPDGTSK